MRSCLIEIHHIRIEDTLELPLMKEQQVIQALLPHTSGEAFAHRIGSGSVIRCFQNLNRTGGRHPSETGPKFVIVITNQILRRLPIRGRFSQRYAPPRRRSGIV
jgi:hypothetical protein